MNGLRNRPATAPLCSISRWGLTRLPVNVDHVDCIDLVSADHVVAGQKDHLVAVLNVGRSITFDGSLNAARIGEVAGVRAIPSRLGVSNRPRRGRRQGQRAESAGQRHPNPCLHAVSPVASCAAIFPPPRARVKGTSGA
jgi:hypothetical protein